MFGMYAYPGEGAGRANRTVGATVHPVSVQPRCGQGKPTLWTKAGRCVVAGGQATGGGGCRRRHVGEEKKACDTKKLLKEPRQNGGACRFGKGADPKSRGCRDVGIE